MGRNLPTMGNKPVAKQTPVVTQGTDPQGVDFNAASTVSYITSYLPGATTPTKLTEAQLNKKLLEMSPQERIAYATRLKAAGYPVGPINGAVTKNLRTSWLAAHSDLTEEVLAGQALDLNSFLAANKKIDETGASKAGVSIPTYQINDTDAAALINSVYEKLAGQKATPQEIANYTKQLRQAQIDNPTKTVYDGTGKSMTTGGINNEQFIESKIEKTAPVLEQRTRNAMTLMAQEIGGLR